MRTSQNITPPAGWQVGPEDKVVWRCQHANHRHPHCRQAMKKIVSGPKSAVCTHQDEKEKVTQAPVFPVKLHCPSIYKEVD